MAIRCGYGVLLILFCGRGIWSANSTTLRTHDFERLDQIAGHGGVVAFLHFLLLFAHHIRMFRSDREKSGSRNTVNLIKIRVCYKREG